MKKKIKTMFYPFVIVVFFMLLTYSCKKETIINPKDLAGSTWIFSDSNNGLNLEETIKFTNNNLINHNFVYTGSSNLTLTFTGIYSYNSPDINIDINHVQIKGTISGVSMLLTTSLGNYKVYIKH